MNKIEQQKIRLEVTVKELQEAFELLEFWESQESDLDPISIKVILQFTNMIEKGLENNLHE